jgi:hypothetical protein
MVFWKSLMVIYMVVTNMQTMEVHIFAYCDG